MGVPAVKRERADARAIRAGEKFCRSTGRLGEIGAHLLDASDLNHGTLVVGSALDAASTRNGGKADLIFQHARQHRVGVTIVVQKPHDRLIAHRGQPRRHP